MAVISPAPDVNPDRPGSPADRAGASVPAPVGWSVRERLSPLRWDDAARSWLLTGLVAVAAFVLRLINLGHPGRKIFDETYYAKEAHDLLLWGAEQNKEGTAAGYVVHPPLGKWMIALGEKAFGYDAFGWRIAAAVVGALSVLLLVRVARRLFGSTLLGCVAGGLLAVDGLHFVMSRVALLDIFLMFFVLLMFACLLLDRDAWRAELLRRLEAGEDLSRGAARLGHGLGGVPWWRLAAAVFGGCALGVKWSAAWFVLAFGVLVLVWAASARRSAGVRSPWRDTIAHEFGWLAVAGVVLLGAYLATWTGWFLSDRAWNRTGAQFPTEHLPLIPDALQNLWIYHQRAYEFHNGLSTDHDYQSTPWSWLLLGRPVAYYYSSDPGCGADACSAEVIALGTPLLWWSFLPALVAVGWRWLARRDWRAATILACVAVGIVPWMFYPERTMFYFYTLPTLPFLVLAVVLALGMVLGPATAPRERRLVGAVAVAAYLVVILITFAYFYPIYTGEQLTYQQWHARMWFDSWI